MIFVTELWAHQCLAQGHEQKDE